MIHIYTILDKDLNYLGMLSLESGTPFFDDIRTVKIADETQKIWIDTLELSVPYGYIETDYLVGGNHILIKGSNDRYYIYTIYDTYDMRLNGKIVKKISCFNKAIHDFNKNFVAGKKFRNANGRDVVVYITTQSGWRVENLKEVFVSGKSEYEVSNNNTQAELDKFITEFDCEVDAYVVVENGRVIDQVLEVVTERGGDTGKRFEYGRGVQNIERKTSTLELFTRLYLFGGDVNGKIVTIASVNNGSKFIVDDTANDLYNGGSGYLTGFLENPDITNPKALLDWGKQEFKKYKQPQYEYTIELTNEDFNENSLGDRVNIVDFEMTPELMVNARIIETNESLATPSNNKIVVGEFVTVKATKPNWINKLEDKAQKAHDEAYKKSWKIELLTPDGLDFADKTSKKRVIARVWRGEEDVTAMLVRSAFVWTKIDENDQLDEEWGIRHLNSGKYIEIGYEESLSTIRCSVKDTLADIPEINAVETDLKFLSRIKLSDKYPQVNRGVQQYVHYDYKNKVMYWTKVTRNETLVSATDQKKAESFIIIRTKLDGTVLDFMTVKWGGHGSHFGFELKNNVPYFLSPMTDTTGKTNVVWACEFPYKAGANITIAHSSVNKIRKLPYRLNRDLKNGYVLGVYGKGDNVTYVTYKDKTFFDKNSKKNYRNHILNSSDFGVRKSQVYQSSCLDFPYLYTTYGQTYQEGLYTYCIDLRTNTLVYKINFRLNKGNINFYHNHGECETINYFYDDKGQKHMIQGFVLRNKKASIGTRQNELYSFIETKRVDEMYEEDLDIEDESLEDDFIEDNGEIIPEFDFITQVEIDLVMEKIRLEKWYSDDVIYSNLMLQDKFEKSLEVLSIMAETFNDQEEIDAISENYLNGIQEKMYKIFNGYNKYSEMLPYIEGIFTTEKPNRVEVLQFLKN